MPRAIREKKRMSNNRELSVSFSATEKFEEVNYDLKLALRRAVIETLEYENFPYSAEVSITLCSDEYIKKLNKKYRNVDKKTDVLSFPLYEDGNFPPDECMLGAPLGDIVICVPVAREQAERLGNSFIREAAFLAIHSTLHLLGYDHERSAEDDEKQCSAQREIIGKMNFEV